MNGMNNSTLATWHKAQAHSWQFYQEHRDNPFGVFSVPELGSAVAAGKVIAEDCEGLCLDVGCGAWPWPSYMSDRLQFIGIDPYFGDRQRAFPFTQAMGETLPFQDTAFNCITIMSVVEHFIKPIMALTEAYRVLRKNGMCFVWFVPRKNSDGHHCWHFTSESMAVLLKSAGFGELDERIFTGDRPGWPPTCMVCGTKAND